MIFIPLDTSQQKITVKNSSLNPLYLVIGTTDGYSEENNGNKYLTLVSTDANKEVLIKHTKLWNRIKYLIKKINDKSGDYDTMMIQWLLWFNAKSY